MGEEKERENILLCVRDNFSLATCLAVTRAQVRYFRSLLLQKSFIFDSLISGLSQCQPGPASSLISILFLVFFPLIEETPKENEYYLVCLKLCSSTT